MIDFGSLIAGFVLVSLVLGVVFVVRNVRVVRGEELKKLKAGRNTKGQETLPSNYQRT